MAPLLPNRSRHHLRPPQANLSIAPIRLSLCLLAKIPLSSSASNCAVPLACNRTCGLLSDSQTDSSEPVSFAPRTSNLALQFHPFDAIPLLPRSVMNYIASLQ